MGMAMMQVIDPGLAGRGEEVRPCDEHRDALALPECLTLSWEGTEDMHGRYDDVAECTAAAGTSLALALVDDAFHCSCLNMVGTHSFAHCQPKGQRLASTVLRARTRNSIHEASLQPHHIDSHHLQPLPS